MLQLRVFGASRQLVELAARLQEIPGSRHVVRTGDGADGNAFVTADLVDDAVDRALEQVRSMGVPAEDVVLVRVETIGVAAAQRPLASVVWTDLATQAGANARPVARYLVFMAMAGVIAAFGVIYENVTLVVGAMAISPDTLPITAAATALVLRRWRLVGRAVAVAAMLALETRASSAVGVAISVTTIPASAYLGVAAGVREASKAFGALLVLGVNVVMLLVGGCLTLELQRRLAIRGRSVTRKG